MLEGVFAHAASSSAASTAATHVVSKHSLTQAALREMHERRTVPTTPAFFLSPQGEKLHFSS